MKTYLTLAVSILLLPWTPALAVTANEYFDAGKTLYQQGNLSQAAKYFEAATQLDPNDWQAYQSLGNCRYQLKQLPEALAAFDKSLALHPDNPQVKAFADTLRHPAASTAPPPQPDVVQGNLDGSGTSDRRLMLNFETAKDQEEKSREGLKEYGETHPLTEDETYVARWGSPKSSFRENHFTVDFGVITPTGINTDVGLFLDPATNAGVAFFYVPLPQQYGSDVYNSSTGTYNSTNVPGDLVYFEPRIKFYSAPSGLTSFQGFSVIYYGLHQGADPEGYKPTNFDIFGLGYLFGFRTLPMDGMTMELGWKLGVAVLFVSTDYEQGQSQYNAGTNSYTYSYTDVQQTTTIPFPYIIPEFRFGFTF